MDDKAKAYLEMAQSLFNAQGASRRAWQGVVSKVMPELLPPSVLAENKAGVDKQKRTCPEAAEAVKKLASAHSNYITPIGFRFFRFADWSPGKTETDAAVDKWYAHATDVAQEAIERSNFHTAIISVYIDRVATGTGLLYSEADEATGELNFQHIPAGTYAIAEDASHNICTVVREFKLTAAQIAQKFGEGRMSADMKRALASPDERYKTEFVILHVVTPRKAYIDSFRDVPREKMRYASVYLDKAHGEILREDGYMEMPYMCTRFLRYGNQVYGCSPLVSVARAIDDLIVLNQCVVTTAQRCAIPSVLVPPDMVGLVDFRAGGQTVLPIQYLNSQVPREFAPPTDARIVLEHRQALVDIVEGALFIPLLEVVSRVDRTMSATEANYREQERIMTFTQSFTQCVSDFRPLMNRVFALLLRAGKLPERNMPANLVTRQVEGQRVVREYLNFPRVAYIGRMAQAYERNQMTGAEIAMTKLVQLGSVLQNPKLTMIFDWDAFARDTAVSNGMPAKYLLEPEEVDELYSALLRERQAQMSAETSLAEAQAREHNANATAALAQAQSL
ncbi:MAG: portal protein [Akkermansia sp.]|nr:portal protein [Akkermansia sp.]